MFKLDGKKIIVTVFPFIILLTAWILAISSIATNTRLNTIFMTLPYIFAFFSMVLSVWFQHSRVFYAVFVLLFSISVLSSPGELNQSALQNGISLVLPVIIIILAVVEERGITSKQGLIKGLVFSVFILFILIDAGNKNPWFAKLKPAIIGNGNIQGIPILSVFFFIICLCVLLTRFFIKSSNMDMAFTGSTLGCFIILHFTQFSDVLSVFSSAVFLIFIIALFEASYSLAFHDTLTGLLSRRAMEQEFLRLGNKYALAIVDIDFFKRVNDNYGHQVGDDVLKMVAASIQKYAKGGKTFRYGGEEFIVIFPRKTAKDVLNILERIRSGIEKRPFIIRGANRPKKKPKEKTLRKTGSGRIRVTVSIGVAEKSEKTRTDNEVIEVADKALYHAKENGRNCIVY